MSDYVYYFEFDHKRIGNLFHKEKDAREFAVQWLFNDYNRVEAVAWSSDIRSGRFSEFYMGSGHHVKIGRLEVK